MWSLGPLPQVLQAEGPCQRMITTIKLVSCLPQLVVQFIVAGAAFDLHLPCLANMLQSYIGNPVW